MRSLVLAIILACGTAVNAEAATISAANARPSIITELLAGQSYTVAVTGVADLNVMYGDGLGLPFRADGRAVNALPGVLTAFNAGTLIDPTSNLHAQATGFAFGALVGSFSASPQQSDYFAIRDGMTLRPNANVTLYGMINDSAYSDNAGGYDAVVSAVAPVPEPATWAMLIVGFAVVGAVMRRRRVSTSSLCEA